MADPVAPNPVLAAGEVAVVGTPDPVPVTVREEVPVVAEATQSTSIAPETVATPPVLETSKTAAETPTLIEEAKVPGVEETKVETKPEEKPAVIEPEKKAEEVKPAEVVAEVVAEPEKVAEAPVEYKYELPTFLAMNDEQRAELTGMLDTFRGDPGNVQPLIDYHVKALQTYDAQVSQRQQDVFLDTRKAWADEIRGDPQLGGSGFETTKGAIARMRDKLGSAHPPGTDGYTKDMQSLQQFFRITGAGDHPAFWRLLHNAAHYLDEPQARDAHLADIQPAPAGKAPGRTGRAMLYDNPTSPNNRNG